MGEDKPDASGEKPVSVAGINPRLLELLVCPVTRAPLVYDGERQELVSQAAGLAYPIRGGAPILIPDQARRLESEQSRA
jgi:uncharacterized protein